MRHTFSFSAFLCAMLMVSAALGALPKKAHALDFHASLTPIRVEALPGQSFNRSFRMTLANTEKRTQFKAHIEDFWRSEDGTKTFYRPIGTLSHSCGSWIKVNPVESTVEPGGTLDVRLTTSVPSDTAPGGYWCALTIDEVADPLAVTPSGVGIRFLASISVFVYIQVGPAQRDARIVDVQVGAEQAQIGIRNTGNCPVIIEGRFEFIRTGETTAVASVTMPRTTILTEPFSAGKIFVPLPDTKTMPSGSYRVRAILDIGLDHFIGAQKDIEVHRGTLTSPPEDHKLSPTISSPVAKP